MNLELDDYVEVIQLEKEYEELKEVYAKAKAFDDIRRIENLCYYVEYDKYSGIDREAFRTHTFTRNTLKTIRNWEDK
ncbi:hypothetical protein NGB30_01695 [Mammaliicoccus fleurettii]|uniref:hypothetical protein n=1 Tax=Mammaliicoccus fleurettii TaxID=150056 RepID=UPI002DBAA39E|nr:hypothetical protein [Mammaliicoccus fleurettii]MEB7779245.1 hypothetical protein [Mammaliicoccus fleurettii]